jgi:hypothetical protein
VYYPYRYINNSFEQPKRDHVEKYIRVIREKTAISVIEGISNSTPLGSDCKEKQTPKLQTRIQDKFPNIPLWEIDDKFKISNDLHPHLHRILSANDDDASQGKVFSGMKPLHLSTQKNNGKTDVINILNGEIGKRGAGFRFKLKANEDNYSRVSFENVSLQFFGTGLAILVFELTLSGDDSVPFSNAVDIVTAVKRLSCNDGHAPKLEWTGSSDLKSEVTLSQLANLLITDIKKTSKYALIDIAPKRLFTYNCVILDDVDAEQNQSLVEMAFRLSRGYTGNYSPLNSEIDAATYQPFENIIHSNSLEGGAIVVRSNDENKKSIPYLEQYIATAVLPVYQPLALVAYHEYVVLLNMSQGSTLHIDFANPQAGDCETLSKYRNALLNMRLNYRFSHASIISMHNDAYKLWRKQLSLTQLLNEVNKDVTEVENYLSFRMQDIQNTKREKLNHVQTVLGILIGAIIGLTGYFGMNFSDPIMVNMRFFDTFFWTSVGVAMSISACMALAYFIRIKQIIGKKE